MSIRTACAAIVASLLASGAMGGASAGDPFEFEWNRLADGVYAGVRPVSFNSPPTGTTVIVIGKKGVLLFDPAGTPLVGERVLAKVRELTDLPVTHMAISHWHGDHSQGAWKIAEAYPDAEIIAHEFTAKAIRSPLNAFTAPDEKANAETRARIEKALATGKRSNGDPITPAMRPYFENIVEYFDLVASEIASLKPIDPTRTMTDRLEIDLGGRKVELRHFGPGNTNGDMAMWLPKEKILATGDIVVRPTPYGFYSHAESWVAVLQKVKALKAKAIVPGHGPIMTDTDYIDRLITTLSFVHDDVSRLAAEGKSLDETRAALDWTDVDREMTADDPLLAVFFDGWFKTPIVEAEYKAATGEDPESLEPAEEAKTDE